MRRESVANQSPGADDLLVASQIPPTPTAMPRAQYVLLFHHFRRLLEAAAEMGIDVAPLKGAHLLSSVYPAGEERGTLSDLDFLVRPADWHRVAELLARLGFVPRPRVADELATHEVGFELSIDERRHILFEAHRYLFDPRRLPIDHDAMWARSVSAELDGAPCRRLAPEDHFVHIAIHAVIHRLDGVARALRDLELLARDAGLDPDLVVIRAREWGTTRMVWAMMSLLSERSSELRLAAQLDALAPPLPVRGAIRVLISEPSRRLLARLHHRTQAGVLWPVLFDSPVRLSRFVLNHRRLGGRSPLPGS